MPPEPAAGSPTLARLDSSSSTSCVLRAARRAHECQFLHFRSAGIMNHPPIGGGERALEAHRGEAFDRTRDGGHDLLPAVGTGAPYRAGPERVEPEADIAGGGVDTSALDIF